MAKDKANIFKFSKNELLQYEKDPLFDCTPGAKEFADGITKSILTKETPYVLLLESKLGMGKTYFSTRFTQFLHNQKIDAIYFSSWENDYLADPFLSFSKEIIKYFNEKYPAITTAKKIGSFPIRTMIAVAKAISINFSSVGVPVNISADKIFNEFQQKTDPFKNFKEKFAKLIKTLKSKKLVLIIDELDRCRPDYAMKTFEIIKHFFDIEGLFIIVPTNETSLNKCVTSLYGINETKESECYFNKFFNHREDLYKPDYLKMVQEYLKKERLANIIETGKLTTINGRPNSFNVLQNKLAELGDANKLTIREMTQACDKAIYFCEHSQQKLDCEYLVYLICKKLSRDENVKCELNTEHPFHYNGKKKEILNFKLPTDTFRISNTGYEQPFLSEYSIFGNKQFNSYKEAIDFLSGLIDGFKNGKDFKNPRNGNYMTISHDYDSILQRIPPLIDEKLKEIEAYKKMWYSDDNDDKVKKYYSTRVESEYKIHTTL